MKALPLGILLALAVGMGFYLYYGIQKPEENKTERELAENRIMPDEESLVTALKISKPDQEPIELVKSERGWEILLPNSKRDLASEQQVELATGSLYKLQQKQVLLEKESFAERKDSLDQYGLKTPQMTVEYAATGREKNFVLHVGNRNPSGSGYYATIDGEDRLLLVSTDLDFLLGKKAYDFRENRLVNVNYREIEELKIQSKSIDIQFKRDEENPVNWVMAKPAGLPIDQAYTSAQLRKLNIIRSNEWLEKAPTTKKADLRVQVSLQEGARDLRSDESDPRASTVELEFFKIPKKGAASKNGDDFEYYAKTDKTPWAKIARFHFDNFNKEASKYVSKKFDDFGIENVGKLEFRRFGVLLLDIQKNEAGDYLVTKSDATKTQAPGNTEQVVRAIESVRGLVAQSFAGREEAPKSDRHSFEVRVKLDDGKARVFTIKAANGYDTLWVKSGSDSYKYHLSESSFNPSIWDFEKLTQADSPKTQPEVSDEPEQREAHQH